jgi:ribosomal protein L37AE/L43A
MINLTFVCAGLLAVIMFMRLAHERELERKREECPHEKAAFFNSRYKLRIWYCSACGKVDLHNDPA